MKRYSIVELQVGLDSAKWTAVDLVDYYLERIAKYDNKLKSIGEINPEVWEFAQLSDLIRAKQGKRSMLEGIPIVVKDNINTADKMHTTAGSLALSDLYAPYDAHVIKKLRDAGAIILGKANLSEFAYFMSDYKMPSGYSSRSGQVKSPYNEKIDPLGSSTGSAVAVAADLIPLSLGTETNGSLMAPSQQNSIVSIKPTFGLVSRYGVIPISHRQDTVGPMAKTVEECALLLDVIAGVDKHDLTTKLSPRSNYQFYESLKMPTRGMKIGILRYDNVSYDDEENKILDAAKEKLSEQGFNVIDIITTYKRINNYQTLIYEYKVALNHYLSTIRGYTKMKNLSDIIAFNKQDPHVRMAYGQTILEAANKTSGTLTETNYLNAQKQVLAGANEANKLLDKHQLDAILSPRRNSWAPIAGNPCICVPAKPLTDLTPRSVIFIGRKWEDEKLLAISYQYQEATKYRVSPKL